MISVTLPDGSVNEYAAGITAGEIVIDIEGRKHDCVAASVDGIERDFSTILQSDCAVEGISGFSDNGIHILRHSAAHLLAQAVTSLYPNAKPTIGPAISRGFYYDFADLHDFGESDLKQVQKKMHEIARRNVTVETIECSDEELNELFQENPYKIEKPLIQLTTNEEKFKKLKKFIYENNDINLRILEKDSIFIKNIQKAFQTKNMRGMISFKDGRINATSLLKTLDKYLKLEKINCLNEEITKIRKSNNQWISTTKNNEDIKSDIVILCNSLKAVDLIESMSHIKLKPVLGQAMEVDIDDAEVDLLSLPKQFNIDGKNIIAKSKNKLIIGSTDEYSTKPEENTFEKLTNFLENKPNWLSKGKISKKWYGIRSKPDGEPSPIMRKIEDGLIICTGFYKNGILLAPACSKWVANEIKNYLS